jgi:hypothetical protein
VLASVSLLALCLGAIAVACLTAACLLIIMLINHRRPPDAEDPDNEA